MSGSFGDVVLGAVIGVAIAFAIWAWDTWTAKREARSKQVGGAE